MQGLPAGIMLACPASASRKVCSLSQQAAGGVQALPLGARSEKTSGADCLEQALMEHFWRLALVQEACEPCPGETIVKELADCHELACLDHL